MAFEELLDQVGGLGKFQILQLVFFLPALMMIIPQLLLENFTAAIPDHRCWVHILDNATVSANGTGMLSQDVLLRISIPMDTNSKPEKCHRFIHPQWQLLHVNGNLSNRSESDMEPCVDGWVYDQSSFPSTIVTEWNLVCDDQSLKSVVQSLFMAGMLVGGFLFGHLSDRFGRKLILRWCLLQLAISGTCAAFAPTFLIYCSLRFLSGCSTSAILTNYGLLIVEWTRPQSRILVVILINSAFSIGQMALGGLAFAFREWRSLQLAVSVPFFIFFLSSRWLVESARWLIINHRPDEGLQRLREVARINGMKTAREALTMEVLRSAMQEELEAAEKRASMLDLFRTPNMRKRIFLSFFVRFASMIPFYGLVVNLQHFGSNIFLLQVIFGAVTAVARFVTLFALNHVGRRLTQTWAAFLLGFSLLVNTFVPPEMQTLRVTLACVGISLNAAISTSFSTHFIELMPTVLRARFLGFDSMAARCGATLAPLLMTLIVYHPTLPWIIYAVSPIFAGVLVLFLPETKNQPLLDTIQDVENSLLTYPHIFLENFMAAIPAHGCWVHVLDNNTVSANSTGGLSQDALLRGLHPPGRQPEAGAVSPLRPPSVAAPAAEQDGPQRDGSGHGALHGRLGVRAQLLPLHHRDPDSCAAFAPTFFIYSSLHFLSGFCLMCILANSIILVTECTVPPTQAKLVVLKLSSYSLGQVLLRGLTFAIRDWSSLQLATSLPLLVFFLLSRRMLESARWLIFTNQLDKGLKELRRAAHINGKKSTRETLTTEFMKTTMQELVANQVKPPAFDLFSVHKLRVRICCLLLLRFAGTLASYGLLFKLHHFGSNIFLLQVLSESVTFTIRCVTFILISSLARRISQLLSILLVGLTYLLNTFLFQEMQMIWAVLAIMGTGAASFASMICSIYSNELIPTTHRTTAAGINIMSSRIGGALASSLVILKVFSPHLPSIIYGGLSILAGFCVFLLPETKNQPFPNTIQDIENE